MTRQRSTWSEDSSRQAATSRRADPYTMNQEHPQPSAVDYESGDPDAWAETPTTNKNVEQEYEGDHVKRNEVGLGEFRDDTWKHKDADQWNGGGKYDNKTAAQRKANACEQIAKAMLRTDNEKMVHDQAVVLMGMPGKHLAATIRRMKQASPYSLPQKARFNRSLACTKMAARLLGETDEKHVEELGRAFMAVDDSTLRQMLKVVQSSDRFAYKINGEPEEKKEDEEKTSADSHVAIPPSINGEPKEEEEEDKTASGTFPASEKKEEEEDTTAGRKMPPEEDEKEVGCEACLCPEDQTMLDNMLQGEAQPAPVPSPAPTELGQLFAGPPEAAPAPAAPMGFASSGPEITFGEDDSDDARVASDGNELNALFDDHPEVQAQREIQAAEQEQAARESGYGSNIHTASTGAKKLGRVQADRAPAGQELEDLWERPE
jgi:hypothetical protein